MDNLLLNYMYQKGYTEEDMYDEQTVVKVRFSFDFIAHKIKTNLKPFFERLAAIVRESWDSIKTAFIEMVEIHEFPEHLKSKTEIPAIDFKRTPMRSQVTDNKPRHLVRKIIR